MNYSRGYLLLLLAGGIPVDIYMAVAVGRLLVSGVVETKPGARPITRATRPFVYWGVTLWILLGVIGMAYALSVAIRLLPNSN